MSEENYLKDITEIKNMMNKSSRFISLSGLSGILVGVYALIGAFITRNILINYENLNPHIRIFSDIPIKLIGIAIIVVALSVLTALILTKKKAKQQGVKIWDTTARRLLFNFLVPLITGGILCLVLLNNNIIGLIAPFTLIFYGLACVNASKYTIGDIQYLGITNIILGLVATQYIGYGLYFWAFGFGILHILYGTVMYFKYDKN